MKRIVYELWSSHKDVSVEKYTCKHLDVFISEETKTVIFHNLEGETNFLKLTFDNIYEFMNAVAEIGSAMNKIEATISIEHTLPYEENA
jgi:hypothetical protein